MSQIYTCNNLNINWDYGRINDNTPIWNGLHAHGRLWCVPQFGMVYACTPIWNGLVAHGRVTVDLHMH